MTDMPKKADSAGGGLIKSPQDFYGALFTLIVAIAAWFLVSHLSSADGFRMGTGTAPRLFAIFLGAMSLCVIVKSFISSGPVIRIPAIRGPVMILGAIVIFALGIKPIGFALTAPLSIFIASFASPDVRPLEALCFAIGLTLVCSLVFIYAIKLPLPLWPAGLS